MKFCDAHWDELRAAIRDRGLWAFVASDGEAVAKRVEAKGFEPLIGAHNAIVGNALDAVGFAIMTNNEDGSERCPLCFLIASCKCVPTEEQPCPYTKWIGFAANDVLEEAKRRGLVGVS